MAEPLMARITITQNDYRQIRKLYKQMPQGAKDAISKAIKDRAADTTADRRLSELLEIMAIFAKFTTQNRDRKLIKDTFNLDDADIQYLIERIAPPDGGQSISCTVDHPTYNQPELFPLPDTERNARDDKEKVLSQAVNIVQNIQNNTGNRIKADYISKLQTVAMAQGAGYNALMETTERNSETKTNHAGVLTVTNKKKSNLKITITDYDKLVARWRPSTRKMLDYANTILTKQNHFPAGFLEKPDGTLDITKDNPQINKTVTFSLAEWQQAQGIPAGSEWEMREKAKEDCQTILYTTLEWEEYSPRTIAKKSSNSTAKKRRRTRNWLGVNIAGSAEVTGGNIRIVFSPAMANYLLNSYITPFPIGLLAIDDRHPNAYAIGRKLSLHYFNEPNRKAKRNTILSVSALLNCTDIPNMDKVKTEYQSKYRERIIVPFLDAMKENERKINLEWQFCNAGGEQLCDNQHPEKKIKDFMSMYILYSLPEAENNSEK